jgi:hypothetical protein
MLTLFRVLLSNKKNPPKAPRYPASSASKERTADLETKPAVVPAFIQFRFGFGETEMLADLSSNL